MLYFSRRADFASRTNGWLSRYRIQAVKRFKTIFKMPHTGYVTSEVLTDEQKDVLAQAALFSSNFFNSIENYTTPFWFTESYELCFKSKKITEESYTLDLAVKDKGQMYPKFGNGFNLKEAKKRLRIL